MTLNTFFKANIIVLADEFSLIESASKLGIFSLLLLNLQFSFTFAISEDHDFYLPFLPGF